MSSILKALQRLEKDRDGSRGGPQQALPDDLADDITRVPEAPEPRAGRRRSAVVVLGLALLAVAIGAAVAVPRLLDGLAGGGDAAVPVASAGAPEPPAGTGAAPAPGPPRAAAPASPWPGAPPAPRAERPVSPPAPARAERPVSPPASARPDRQPLFVTRDRTRGAPARPEPAAAPPPAAPPAVASEPPTAPPPAPVEPAPEPHVEVALPAAPPPAPAAPVEPAPEPHVEVARPAPPPAPAAPPAPRPEPPVAAGAPPPATGAAPAPEVPAAPLPTLVVEKTVWHPLAERRLTEVRVEGRAGPVPLREGDVVADLVVVRIEPSGVVFRRGDREIRRGVGER